MLLWVLGIFDIVAGVALGFGGLVPYVNNSFIVTIAAIMIIKGLWSIITAAANAFFFDIIGILDLVGGILLLLTTAGIFLNFFVYLGIALVLKGLWSIIAGIMSAGN